MPPVRVQSLTTRVRTQTPGEVAVSYDIAYASHEKAGGTFTVNKNGSTSELVFDGLKLEDAEKKSVTVSGKIPF